MVVHISAEQMAAYIDGTLSEAEQQAVEQHLGGCPLCDREAGNIIGVLAEVNALSPTTLDHPLESLVRPLQRLELLPAWAWNVLLVLFSYLAWTLALSAMRTQDWLGLLLLPGLLLLTGQFIWLQPRLRGVVYGLWQGRAAEKDLARFDRRLKWLQGWSLGGLWFLAGLGLLFHLTFLPELWSAPWEWVKQALTGFYVTVVLGAVYWGWAWGGVLWHTLADMLRVQPDIQNLPVVAHARRLALSWVVVASLSLAWVFFFQENHQPVVCLWEGLAALALLILWTGYIRLELRLSRLERRSGVRLARVLLALALLLVPLGLLLTVN